MKKLFIGLLAFGTTTAFAFETTCQLQDRVYSNVDASFNKSNRVLKVKYAGSSKLELIQNVIEGFTEELHLTALSRSIETRVGSKVRAYGELESFAASFAKRDSASGIEVRMKIYEDKTFQLFVENELGKLVHAYSGKCKAKLTKEDARLMIQDIDKANAKIAL